MIITYLILKLTLQSVLNECNRIATEQMSKEQITILKSKLLKLRLEYDKGLLSEEAYNMRQAELLKDLRG